MKFAHAAALAGAVVFSLAHVGSPDTIFEGQAGPYAVRVVVRTPGVVPGLADIAVRITAGPAGSRVVTVIPLRGGLPTAQEPPPDTARVVAGDSALYSAQLWLMRFGAYSVRVTVDGAGGPGSVIVPVNAVAVGRLDMKRPVAIALIALGLFLFVGAVTIVYAAVRESVLAPGEIPSPRRQRAAVVVAILAGCCFVLYLLFGNWWWGLEDRAFRGRIYRAPEVTSAVVDRGAARVFRLSIADSATFRRQMSPLIPDHGKLMHLFLVGASDQAVAHLHPLPVDSTTFEAALPPLPAGTYYVFADIVHETGFSQTLTDTLALPAAAQPAWAPSDPDDAWLAGESGTTIAWSRPAELRSGTDMNLTFAAPGAPLEPYMGMAGHAIVARSDGRVFVHLHPNGTIPMAAQLVYELREPGDTVRGRLGRRITERSDAHAPHVPAAETVIFPYAFPEPGRYRIWVQIKSRGRIVTGAFEAEVT
jgi:hypothetical protein